MMRQNLFSEFMLPSKQLGVAPTKPTVSIQGKMAWIGAVAVGALLSKLYIGKLGTSSVADEAKSVSSAILPSSVLLVSGPAIELALGKHMPQLVWLGIIAGCGYLLYKTTSIKKGNDLFKVLRVAIGK